MRYKMVIERYDKNLEYETQMEEYKSKLKYGSFNSMGDGPYAPQPEQLVKTLEVALNAEEWEKIKGAVLELFK